MISELVFVFIFFSYLIIFSSISFETLKKTINFKVKKGYKSNHNLSISIAILSLALGFISFFSIFSILNLNFHGLGIGISLNLYWIISIIVISYLLKKEVKTYIIFIYKLLKEIKYEDEIKNLFNLSFKFPIISLAKFLITIQIIITLYKLFLPVTHGDQLENYFFDALQISRLNHLSINEFYLLGNSFRTDSLGAFFDGFIIQLSGSWAFTRIAKVLSLFISLLVGIEFMYSLKKIRFVRIILFVAVVTSLIDIWSLTVSGKFDIYVLLLEITAFRLVLFSSYPSNFKQKILVLAIPLTITITSVFVRLSSISLLIFLIGYLIYQLLINIEETKLNYKFLLKVFTILLIFSSLSGLILFFNFSYMNNPFFILSPPDFLNKFFPNPIFTQPISKLKNLYNLQNIHPILNPPITILYSSLGFEQIRFFLSKFSDSNIIFKELFDTLSFIGPKKLMIAIDSFSPILLLAFWVPNNKKDLYRNYSIKICILLFIWLTLWTFSIAYTRVALASSTLLVGFAIAYYEPKKYKTEKNIIFLLRKTIFSYGLFLSLIYSLWGFSSIFDLPNISNHILPYNRSNLVREFIKIDAIIHPNDNRKIPNKIFEENWKSLNNNYINSEKPDLLLNVPKHFAYFMDHGIIIINESWNDHFLINSPKNNKALENYEGNAYYLINDFQFKKVK